MYEQHQISGENFIFMQNMHNIYPCTKAYFLSWHLITYIPAQQLFLLQQYVSLHFPVQHLITLPNIVSSCTITDFKHNISYSQTTYNLSHLQYLLQTQHEQHHIPAQHFIPVQFIVCSAADFISTQHLTISDLNNISYQNNIFWLVKYHACIIVMNAQNVMSAVHSPAG